MNNYTILIVDDLVENLKTINSIFEEYRPEYNILQTNSAESALKILQRNKPDAIITDWDMPGMNGIDFIKKLKLSNEFNEIPVIMATGVNLTSENLKTALDAGAIDYIRKPFEAVELIARTQSVLMISTYHKRMLQTKDEELTESALYLVRGHKFTVELTKKLDALKQLIDGKNVKARSLLGETIAETEHRIKEDGWHRFNLSFNKVHESFEKNLLEEFPDLTKTDLKLCAFIRLGMKNKDIASVLNQSPDSIKVSRSRLRKKLKIDQAKNLETYLATF